MFRCIMISLLLLLAGSAVSAQDINARSVKATARVHQLVMPQEIRVVYPDGEEKIEISGYANNALLSKSGNIPLNDIDYFVAKRFKPAGLKVLGGFVTVLGLLATATGIAAAADPFFDGSPVWAMAISGIAITAGGIAILSTKKKYVPGEWQFYPDPAEAGKVPVTYLNQ